MKTTGFFDKVKKFFTAKGIGYYVTLPALAFCIAALCLYVKNGVTSFNTELNTAAIVYISVCMGLCVISLAIDFEPIRSIVKTVKYIAYVLCLFSFMWFIYSQVTYIANVFVAIDGYTFTSGFTATVVFYGLSFIFVLLSAIFDSFRPWKKKSVAKGGTDNTAAPAGASEEVNA